jgi:hypothetical protein
MKSDEETIKFKDLDQQSLIEKIRLLKKDQKDQKSFCFSMFNTAFNQISPDQKKSMKLKNEYKPKEKFSGLGTINHNVMKDNDELVDKAENKLQNIGMRGEHYAQNEASFKLHLNLNGIGEIDESVILGLVKLLVDEAEAVNDMSYNFKIITPKMHNHERFKDTDQITIYFDKYSSTGDIISLAAEIEKYLKGKGLGENKIARGPKDSFGFNSFVSARFDTSKLLARYDVYTFFDKELGAFFNKHKDDSLNHMPLCVFESIFNYVLFSDEIKLTDETSLSEEDTKNIQAQFEKAYENPKNYIINQTDKYSKRKLKDEKSAIEELEKMSLETAQFKQDFSQCNTLEAIDKYVKDKKAFLDKFISADTSKKNFLIIDSIKFQDLKKLAGRICKDLYVLAAERKRDLYAPQFDILLREFEKKTLTLLKDEPKNEESKDELKDKKLESKGGVAMALYNTLHKEFEAFKLDLNPQSAYASFKDNCTVAIEESRSVLEQHRDKGWKKLLLNILAGILSFGAVPIYTGVKTKGARFFFEVSTDSMNKVNKMKQFLSEHEESETKPSSFLKK